VVEAQEPAVVRAEHHGADLGAPCVHLVDLPSERVRDAGHLWGQVQGQVVGKRMMEWFTA
jgi:hypothetical protein